MREMIPNKSLILEAWEFASTTPKWSINWPRLSNLWRRVMVLPLSTAICERGFSKQNLIKSYQKLETLDALMRSLCANIPVEIKKSTGMH